jgi:hypothetical protein
MVAEGSTDMQSIRRPDRHTDRPNSTEQTATNFFYIVIAVVEMMF